MKHRALALLVLLLAATSPVCRPQQPDGASTRTALTVKDVEFQSGGVTLSGTLTLPPNPIAGMVLVHGSGKALRY